MSNKIKMPSPILIGKTWYLRVRIPADLINKVKGQTVSLPVNGDYKRIKIGESVKISLSTSDETIAKYRFAETHAALLKFYENTRLGPQTFSHKESLGLAGYIANMFIESFDQNPSTIYNWKKFIERDEAILAGKYPVLQIPPKDMTFVDFALDLHFGKMAEAVLNGQGLLITPQSKKMFTKHLAQAHLDMSRVLLRKAMGDYSDSKIMEKYPPYEDRNKPSKTIGAPHNIPEAQTFNDIINIQEQRRQSGRNAKALSSSTIKEYRLACHEFSEFRKSDIINTVSAFEAQAWLDNMLSEKKLGNRTIGERLNSVNTVVSWARTQSLGTIFKEGNPIALIEKPTYQAPPSYERAFTLEEAQTVLRAARLQKASETRWIPWLSAYSEARISELQQLKPHDFIQVDGLWFFKLTASENRRLKTIASERRVPVHPDLIKEGIIDFVLKNKGTTKPLFPHRSQGNISEWIRIKLKIKREGLAPNHGWRHLFEDLCMKGGVSDAARLYIAGRSSGRSDQLYGRSNAMLSGLYREMEKIPSFL